MFIKVCGITNTQDALDAVALGADALGFLLAESPRKISAKSVREIVKQLPANILTIGVFRDQDSRYVIDTVREAGLIGAQLHGQETSAQVAEVMAEVNWVAKSVIAGSAEASSASNYGTEIILVDSANPGTGTSYDLDLIQQIPTSIRLILSGGLTVMNVSESIRAVSPWGVDVSSGVEASPGIKDKIKMREFITNARETD
jgi:phosphoribosylanthranilate isomerase